MRIQSPNKIILAKKETKDLRIFLDLDGVVSFWIKSAAKICDLDIEEKETRNRLKNGTRFEDFLGGDDVMWSLIDKGGEDFWSKMEILPWGKKLYDLLNKKTSLFSFLTSPSNNPECASGKVKWLQNHFGDKFKDFLIGKHKYLCASPNSLLVDDDKKNCKKFEEHGGWSFYWPEPLSLMDEDVDIDDTFNKLSDFIRKIKNDD